MIVGVRAGLASGLLLVGTVGTVAGGFVVTATEPDLAGLPYLAVVMVAVAIAGMVARTRYQRAMDRPYSGLLEWPGQVIRLVTVFALVGGTVLLARAVYSGWQAGLLPEATLMAAVAGGCLAGGVLVVPVRRTAWQLNWRGGVVAVVAIAAPAVIALVPPAVAEPFFVNSTTADAAEPRPVPGPAGRAPVGQSGGRLRLRDVAGRRRRRCRSRGPAPTWGHGPVGRPDVPRW